MRFTIDREALVKMVQHLAGRAQGSKRSDPSLVLTAAGAMVFVEANETTAGVEALVMQEGTCSRVARICNFLWA